MGPELIPAQFRGVLRPTLERGKPVKVPLFLGQNWETPRDGETIVDRKDE